MVFDMRHKLKMFGYLMDISRLQLVAACFDLLCGVFDWYEQRRSGRPSASEPAHPASY
jgi:hypothetical protein